MIGSLLEKARLLLAEHSGVREHMLFVCKKVCNISLQKSDIQYRDTIIIIKTKPIYHNEILFKKKEILLLVQEVFPKVSDIR